MIKQYINDYFVFLFNEAPNELAINSLIEEHGETAVRAALGYFVRSKVAGQMRPPKEGKGNPYALLDKFIKNGD